MRLGKLDIATDIRIHPEFVEAPQNFALRQGVDLATDVSPETSFKREPETLEKRAKVKTNIHLVEHRAIRLFTERDDKGDWIRTIELTPSLLLYGVKNHPLTDDDLLMSLSLLKEKVAPLLAYPNDVNHIVPGLASNGEAIAYWSGIESEILLPGILLPCIHDLRHPKAGPADGATNKRIQLGDKSARGGSRAGYVICLQSAKWENIDLSGEQIVNGISVTLRLGRNALPAEFARFGTTASVNGIRRLTAFPASSVARVHQSVMSRLEGTYLPVPPEWTDRSHGKAVTRAKTLALFSQLTPIPLEELRGMHDQQRPISESTRRRLDQKVAVAMHQLNPVPVSTLFGSEVYSAHEPPTTARTDQRVDPEIEEAYG
jgi:hypothetical protein